MPATLPESVYRRRRLAVAAAAAILLLLTGFAVTRLADGGDAPGAGVAATASTTAPSTTPEAAPTSTTAAIASTGRFTVAPGSSAVAGTGPLQTYVVEVEEGIPVDVAEFAAAVDATLADPRGWTTADGISLQRVDHATPNFRVRLTTPDTTDVLCFPLQTGGSVSCAKDGAANLNLIRWQEGAVPSKLDLADYRHYLVSHEVGHVLGHDHVDCPGPGALAPTMLQQTLSIGECAPNPWPVPDARAG